MAEFAGFDEPVEEDDAFEEAPDIEQPEFEDIFIGDNDASNLGRKREGADRLSPPFLGKLGKSRLISARSIQLNLGAPPIIPIDQLHSNELQEIAIQEFNAAARREVPFPIRIIRRYADGTYDEWKVSDFKYFVRDIGRPQRSRQRKLKIPAW